MKRAKRLLFGFWTCVILAATAAGYFIAAVAMGDWMHAITFALGTGSFVLCAATDRLNARTDRSLAQLRASLDRVSR